MSERKNKMGVVELTVITAVNMMGSGIIMLPSQLAKVGTMSILSWLVTAVGAMALAYSFAKCGMLSKKGGGMGGYAEYAFGKSGSFLANYTYGISLAIANVAIAVSVVGYGVIFLGTDLSAVQNTIAIIVVLWLTTVANFGGPKITGRIGTFTVWGVIIPVFAISILGWFWFSPSLYIESWNPHHLEFFPAVSQSISMTLWSFLGLESACANMDAVENPQKNVPIAVLVGTLTCAVVYIISTNVMQGIVPNAKLVASTAPFGLAFAYMFNETVGKVVMGLMVLACFGSLLSWQFTIGQVFKSSAIEGYFPQIFKKATSSDTPIVGMTILTIVQTLFSFMTISPDLNNQFNVIVNLAVVTNLVPYLLSMGALKKIQHVEGVPDSKASLPNYIALFSGIYSLYSLYTSGAEAMLYGGLVTFAGWTCYGLIANRFNNDGQKADA